MTKSKNAIIVALTAICLIATLFVATPISGSPGPGEYDPWTDLNNDGEIDIFDIVQVALRFSAKGTPYVGKAAFEYDSEWMNITNKCGQYYTINHNLNNSDVMVEITGKTTLDGGTHQKYFGLTSFNQEWSRTYGSGNNEIARHVIQTTDGGYMIAGYVEGIFLLSTELWLVKTDAIGNVLWQKTYDGGTGVDEAYSVIQTRDGGYVAVGRSNSWGSGGYDFYVLKTDQIGNKQWAKLYGGTSDDYAMSVVQTADGGYTIAGVTESFTSGLQDFWLVKVDASGVMQWNKAYGGSADDVLYSIVQTNDGGYALGGYTHSFGVGSSDFWLIKTDASGNMQWNRTYGGASYDEAHSAFQTNDGGYALAGETWSFGGGTPNYWLVKTDALGNMQWNRTYGGSGTDKAYSAIQTSEGGYALTGYTLSYGAGSYDFWLVKTDSTGNVQWDKTYGGTNEDVAISLIQTKDGSYSLAGYTKSYGGGNQDFYLVKTCMEQGLALTNTTLNTITLYRGETDPYWNFVRIRIWKPQETP
jgi:hypothetical protein